MYCLFPSIHPLCTQKKLRTSIHLKLFWMSQGLVHSMEGQYEPTQSGQALGLGLSIGMVLISVFSMSCVVYWLSCRGNHQSCASDARPQPDIEDASPIMPAEPISRGLRPVHGATFSVLMPGDRMPKFVAMLCPREGTQEVPEKVVDHVEEVADEKLPQIIVPPR